MLKCERCGRQLYYNAMPGTKLLCKVCKEKTDDHGNELND